MNSENILEAVGQARGAYLDHAMEQRAETGRKRRPLRAALLVAAAVALLVTSVYAATTAWKIAGRKTDPSWYELYFEENPAAADAPDTLEQYYLPRSLPVGYEVDLARVSYGDAFSTESTVEWLYGGYRADLDALIDQWYATWTQDENGQPLPLTAAELAALEEEHPMPSLELQSVVFTQRPLKCLWQGDVFAFMSGSLDDVTRGEVTLGDRGYVTMTHTTDRGEEVSYYWVDEARHYVFSLQFSAGIPREEREAVVQSVAPVEKAEYTALLGADAYAGAVYVAQVGPTGYDKGSVALVRTGEGELYALSDWQDLGHGVTLCVGSYMEDELQADAGVQVTEFTLDGTKIVCAASDTTVNGEPFAQESWFFTAPDGETALWLEFFSTDGTKLSAEEKEAVFRGIAAVDPAEIIR